MMRADNLLSIAISILVGLIVWWGYNRLFRGTAKKLGLVFSIILGGIAFVFPNLGKILGVVCFLAVVPLEVWHIKNKKTYSHIQLIYEGGGIRRGLQPVEVGALYSLTPNKLFALGFFALLEKGLVKSLSTGRGGLTVVLDDDFQHKDVILNPKSRRENRQEIAYQKKMQLSTSEDVLLEIFEQNVGKSLGDYSIQPWVDVLNRTVDNKLSGYDAVETQGYYKEFSAHRLGGIEEGHFNPQDYIGWMILSRYLGDINDQKANHWLNKSRPSWIQEGETIADWLNLVSSVSW